MQNRKVEVAVIGAGTAGLTAYNAARKHTDDLLLIEGDAYGTTCARVGCMPSKLLIAAAERAHSAAHSGSFGIRVNDLSVDGEAVMERVRRLRDKFVGSVLDSIEKIPDEHKVRGEARFLGPLKLAVGDGLEVEAGRIVIATGSSPHVPENFRRLGDRLLTSDCIFELKTLPDSVAVFGSGPLGLELGQALSRLGVRVWMFGQDGSLGGIADGQIRRLAEECFNEEFYLDTDATVQDVCALDAGVSISFTDKAQRKRSETFDYVLAATGRRANLGSLALEASGLGLDEQGIPVADPSTLQCQHTPVFLAGDANGRVPLLHEAAHEGRIAGDNAGRYPNVVRAERKVPFSIVFSSPQIASVGVVIGEISNDEANRYCTGTCRFENQGRSRVIGENRGLLKVYAERSSGRLAGAEMFGPAAEHIGHLLAWAAQQRLTVTEMLAMPFYHPVIEEGVRTALKDCRANLEHLTRRDDPCLSCGPGG